MTLEDTVDAAIWEWISDPVAQVGPDRILVGNNFTLLRDRIIAALRRSQPEGEMVIVAARSVSAFVKSHDYPTRPSPDFEELTRLLDIQDTALRKLSAAEAEGRKG